MVHRLRELDIAKGVGICLVVLGHCVTITFPELTKIIDCFHMPLFFFVSGLTYKQYATDDLVVKKFHSLCIPLIIYTIYNELLHLCTMLLPNDKLQELVYSCFQIRGQWFLETLLIVTIIAHYITGQKKLFRNLTVFALYFLGMIISCFDLPVSVRVENSLVALGFYWCGIIASPLILRLFTLCQLKRPTALLLAGGGGLLLTPLIILPGETVQFYRNVYGNPILFTLKAYVGIALVLLISAAIGKSNFWEYLGQNSLIILVTHFPVYRTLTQLNHFLKTEYEKCYSIVCFLVTILITAVLVRLITNYFPEFGGKRRSKSTVISTVNKGNA